MANQALYDTASYQVPGRILQQIQQALAKTPAGVDGVRRATGIIKDPNLTYSGVKRLKADLETPGAARTQAYELAGGSAMLTWVNQQLELDRNQVIRRQTTRSNAGGENQFKRTHEKNGFTAPVTTHISASSDSVRRQELYEQASPISQACWQEFANQLIKLFPELVFEKNSDTDSVTILTRYIQIMVTLPQQ